MNFINAVRAFFTTYRKAAPANEAVRRAFEAAIPHCDAAFRELEHYSSLANLHKELRFGRDPAIFEELSDLEPYNEAILDAHNDAVDNLSTAFDALTDAFAAFTPDDYFYAGFAKLYKVYCEYFTLSVTRFSDAADFSKWTALEDHNQALKDECEAMFLALKADRPNEVDAVVAKAKAAAFKAKVIEDKIIAERLMKKADVAREIAVALLATAKHCEAKAEEAVGKSQ